MKNSWVILIVFLVWSVFLEGVPGYSQRNPSNTMGPGSRSHILQERLIPGEENEKNDPASFDHPDHPFGVVSSYDESYGILLDDTEGLVLDSIVGYVFSGADSVAHTRTIYSYDLNKYLSAWLLQRSVAGGRSWENVEKQEFLHNEAGKETMNAKYVWDEDKHEWRVDMKWIYDYNAMGSMTLAEGYWWSDYTQKLIGMYKWEKEYYDSVKVKCYTYYDWDDDLGRWAPDHRNKYSYTDSSKVTLYSKWPENGTDWNEWRKEVLIYKKYKNTYEYQQESQDWFLVEQVIYSYNETGDTLRSSVTTVREWPDTVWHNEMYLKRAYDGLQVTDTFFSWDKNDSVWVYSEMAQDIYDDAGRCLSTMNYAWNAGSASWYVYFGCKKTYNEAGKRTSFEAWTYHIDYRREYEYDEKNRLIRETRFDWDDNTQDLIPAIKKEYAYDDKDSVLFRIEYSWDDDQEEWFLEIKYWYYYGPFSGIEDLKDMAWKIYPNPASDYLVIAPEDNVVAPLNVFFYNLSGQVVKEVVLDDPGLQKMISVKDLRPGYYLVRLYCAGELLSSRKVVIQR